MHVGNPKNLRRAAYLSFCCLIPWSQTACVEIPPIGGGDGGGSGGSGGGSGSTAPFQEIYDLGLLDHVGDPALEPTSVDDSLWYSDLLVHRFELDPEQVPDGPTCMRGDDFFVETRDGDGDGLMIFLQGGGVCMDEICAATVNPTLNLRLLTTGDLVGISGILDKGSLRNPVADYDVVHVPYCDGSVFMGEVDRTLDDGNWTNGSNDEAYQRGLINLIASLQVAKARYPNPSNIVLAGTSGGGYGVVMGMALVRHFYPDTEVSIVADSGAPILTSENPGFIRSILTQVDAIKYIPASCSGCIDNGHATDIIDWALERDSNFRVAYMGHARDHVIGEYFMGSTAEQFETSVVNETGRLIAHHPGRVFRYIKPGSGHMMVLDVQAVGTALEQISLYLFGEMLFTGPDVDADELATWELGKLGGDLVDERGRTVDGYDFLDTFINDPADCASVTQLGPGQ